MTRGAFQLDVSEPLWFWRRGRLRGQRLTAFEAQGDALSNGFRRSLAGWFDAEFAKKSGGVFKGANGFRFMLRWNFYGTMLTCSDLARREAAQLLPHEIAAKRPLLIDAVVVKSLGGHDDGALRDCLFHFHRAGRGSHDQVAKMLRDTRYDAVSVFVCKCGQRVGFLRAKACKADLRTAIATVIVLAPRAYAILGRVGIDPLPADGIGDFV